MELKERIKLYLKTRNEPVSRNEFLSVASAAGASRDDIYRICSAFQDFPSSDDVNIGVWWGYKKNNDPSPQELKTLWLRFYSFQDDVLKRLKANLKWYDELKS